MGNGRSWAEVDVSKIIANYRAYKDYVGCEVMAVVKANAYGHGAVPVSRKLQEIGVFQFAVATVDEGIELRDNGIEGLILILGYTPPSRFIDLESFNLSQAIISEQYKQTLLESGVKTKVHIAIDTGMNRVGIKADDPQYYEQFIRECEGQLNVEGIFTHLCVADTIDKESIDFTRTQIEKFDTVLERVQDLQIPYRHCINSAGGLNYKSKYSNMDRLGIIMYGLLPDNNMKLPIEITPALTWKSTVTMVKTVLPGESVSYGRMFTADKEMRIAVISTGYADGYNRMLSNKGHVLIHGQSAPIVGRVCMDQFMVDVTEIEAVPGDEVVLIDGKNFTADDMAECIGTIGYEVVCNISNRVPREYN